MTKPYYLHKLDGSRCHRGSIIVVDNDPTAPTIEHNIGGSPLIDRDGAPQTYDRLWTLGPVTTRNEATVLAGIIAARWCYDAMIDGKLIGPTVMTE
jgi:hypothetical protein